MAIAEPPKTIVEETGVPERPSRWARWADSLSIIWDSRIATFGLILVLFWVIVGFISLFWTPYPPNASLFTQNLPPLSSNELGGINVLGTDHLGRDLLSRLMTGTQVILLKTRLPETTASQYMLGLAGLAGLVSLTTFFGMLATSAGKHVKRNIFLLAAGWLVVSVGLYFVLPDTVPSWTAFAGTFAVIYLGYFIYGWLKTKELGLTTLMKVWTISLVLTLLFAALSIPLQGSVIPGFSIPFPSLSVWQFGV